MAHKTTAAGHRPALKDLTADSVLGVQCWIGDWEVPEVWIDAREVTHQATIGALVGFPS